MLFFSEGRKLPKHCIFGHYYSIFFIFVTDKDEKNELSQEQFQTITDQKGGFDTELLKGIYSSVCCRIFAKIVK